MSVRMIEAILNTLPEAEVCDVWVGLHWTAVVIEKNRRQFCGLASTLTGKHIHGEHAVTNAGKLTQFPARVLANFAQSDEPVLVSVGMAAINALLTLQAQDQQRSWVEMPADQAILENGSGKHVALIGHFPFIARIRNHLARLDVLELNPLAGDLPAKAAPEILPKADVVAISSMTFVNNTLDELIALCKPNAFIILVGPTTPLSPVLFEFGVNLLCGSVVQEIQPVIQTLGQGACFSQISKAGVRRVTMKNS